MSHVFRTEAAAVKKAIAGIKARGLKLDADIQAAGLDVLYHAAKHGDTTLADALVHALPNGSRKLALVEWMLAFGTFAKLNTSTKDGKAAAAAGRLFQCAKKDGRVGNLHGAELKLWTEFKKEPHVLTAFDAQGSMKSFLRKLTEATDKGLTVEGQAEAIALMHAALAKMGAPVPEVAANA